jgi:hypothetical protein
MIGHISQKRSLHWKIENGEPDASAGDAAQKRGRVRVQACGSTRRTGSSEEPGTARGRARSADRVIQSDAAAQQNEPGGGSESSVL